MKNETKVAGEKSRSISAKDVMEKDTEETRSGTNGLIDLERLRLGQDFQTMAGVKKLILTIPVQKPNRQEFIRVHPDEQMSLTTMVLESLEDREIYLVADDLWDELETELQPKRLLVMMNRHRDLKIWPVAVPQDGRTNPWTESAIMAAEKAKRNWVRVASNMRMGAYDVYTAASLDEEPEWHELPLQEILRIAFKGKYIQSMDHPVVRRLKGLI